jgi:osmotically-inducible protein OsmY
MKRGSYLLKGARGAPFNNKVDLVTLGGKAKNAAEKDLATKFANDVNGVKGVKNRMTIRVARVQDQRKSNALSTKAERT